MSLEELQEESRKRHNAPPPPPPKPKGWVKPAPAKKRYKVKPKKVIRKPFVNRVENMQIKKEAKIALYAAQIDSLVVFFEG